MIWKYMEAIIVYILVYDAFEIVMCLVIVYLIYKMQLPIVI